MSDRTEDKLMSQAAKLATEIAPERDLWPGIDLHYEATASRLKYTFVVEPGADPNLIQLAYEGAEIEIGSPAPQPFANSLWLRIDAEIVSNGTLKIASRFRHAMAVDHQALFSQTGAFIRRLWHAFYHDYRLIVNQQDDKSCTAHQLTHQFFNHPSDSYLTESPM